VSSGRLSNSIVALLLGRLNCYSACIFFISDWSKIRSRDLASRELPTEPCHTLNTLRLPARKPISTNSACFVRATMITTPIASLRFSPSGKVV